MPVNRNAIVRTLVLLFTLLGLQQWAGVAVIQAKAWLAPHLLERAWDETLATGTVGHLPWPWADTWPVARLRAPSQGVNLLVLAGDSGNALAFGPGHSLASASLGSGGTVVIGGHRDTHFAFLQQLQTGDTLALELPNGDRRIYQVNAARIDDASTQALVYQADVDTLLLVTCYPFDALLSGGSLRYVIEALPQTSVEYGSTLARYGSLRTSL